MILIKGILIENINDLNSFKENYDQSAYTNEHKKIVKVFKEYLDDIFLAHQEFESYFKKVFPFNYNFYIILPEGDCGDYSGFNGYKWKIEPPHGEKVKIRDELIFKNYFEKCFKDVEGLYSRLLSLYSE